MFIGIDPGWANLGIGILDSDGSFLASHHIDLKHAESFLDAVSDVEKVLAPYPAEAVSAVVIERYVLFGGGTPNKDAEFITMVGGGLAWRFASQGVPVAMRRSIEWKPLVCKLLYRDIGFKNPSTSFDKRYSKAAARAITQQSCKTDHEAEAICMAYLAYKSHASAQSTK